MLKTPAGVIDVSKIQVFFLNHVKVQVTAGNRVEKKDIYLGSAWRQVKATKIHILDLLAAK